MPIGVDPEVEHDGRKENARHRTGWKRLDMKILVIGLDDAPPELILRSEDLPNLRHLMAAGAYGTLDGAGAVASSSARMSLAAHGQTIWDHLACSGRRSILVDALPGHPQPARPLNGISVWGLAGSDSNDGIVTDPPELSAEVCAVWGQQQPDSEDATTVNEQGIGRTSFTKSIRTFQVARHLLRTQPWDYFQLVDVGLSRLSCSPAGDDPASTVDRPDGQASDLLQAYGRHLDHEIGEILAMLSDETIVLVVSTGHVPRLSTGSNAPASSGAFILVAPESPLGGPLEGVSLADLAPTLLDLAGYELPASMQGRSLVSFVPEHDPAIDPDDVDRLVRERLSGLGYI